MPKIPVLFTFDMDAETLWTARDPEGHRKPVWLSQGHYGPTVGLPRILGLLDRYGIPATFFIPGRVVENYPAQIEQILAAGLPIEHHSYSHTWSDSLGAEEEEREFQQGWDAILAATGRKPQGWRSPAGELTAHSIPLMEKFGLGFSSNMFDADTAYLLRDGERATQIVELPFAWALDDAPFFMYSNRLPGRVMAAPSVAVETWCREYDGLAAEPGTHFMIAMHPQVTGRPSRLWALEQTIKHILGTGTAEFLTCADYVARVRPSLTQGTP
ncbi:polysaccharide deacetylase family protein [Leekyejoonella antrihumi]|uniref:Polysaccharide deacetylase n=1 Tax=Leekyejoonella antrihumi TaxID=1660198 RepID=A0A563DSL8_9MICO|nr:polysaccharide deacetylase [Leekyejoonella antrihumi]TWP33248.1 polysaccharide deacetylase [Leekyejoonella antrihumi]